MEVIDKVQILERSPDQKDRAAHLLPVIEFLIMLGNVPFCKDFIFDKKGIGTFLFIHPIDVNLLRKRFDFPPSISVNSDTFYAGGYIFDRMNGLEIRQVR